VFLLYFVIEGGNYTLRVSNFFLEEMHEKNVKDDGGPGGAGDDPGAVSVRGRTGTRRQWGGSNH
jgi:hypothetical protein